MTVLSSRSDPAAEAAALPPPPAPPRKRWEPMRLEPLGSISDVAMPGILKTGSITDGVGTRKPVLT